VERDGSVHLMSMSCLFRHQLSIYFRGQHCLQTTHEEGGEEILLDSLNCPAREIINGKTALRVEGFDAVSGQDGQHCREREFMLAGKTFLISSMSSQECIGISCSGEGF